MNERMNERMNETPRMEGWMRMDELKTKFG